MLVRSGQKALRDEWADEPVSGPRRARCLNRAQSVNRIRKLKPLWLLSFVTRRM